MVHIIQISAAQFNFTNLHNHDDHVEFSSSSHHYHDYIHLVFIMYVSTYLHSVYGHYGSPIQV